MVLCSNATRLGSLGGFVRALVQPAAMPLTVGSSTIRGKRETTRDGSVGPTNEQSDMTCSTTNVETGGLLRQCTICIGIKKSREGIVSPGGHGIVPRGEQSQTKSWPDSYLRHTVQESVHND